MCVNELLFKFMGCDIIAAIRYVKCHYTTTCLGDYKYMWDEKPKQNAEDIKRFRDLMGLKSRWLFGLSETVWWIIWQLTLNRFLLDKDN